MADTPDVTAPAPEELRQLLDIHHPASVLGRLTVAAGLPDPLPVELVVCQAEALIDLDRSAAALDLLNAHADRLQAVTSLTVQAQGLNLQALILNRAGWHDAAVLLALQAAGAAQDDDSRALALVNAAAGYACKNCWGLSDQYLRDALELSPTNPRVLAAQARIRLEADQRLEARSVYERLAELPAPWARPVALWGLAYTAYLLGEFGLAENQARAALMLSNEYVPAIFTLAQVALVRGDLPGLHQALFSGFCD